MGETELDIELDDLIRSIDDLDAEFAAGDLDEPDYLTLRDSYTVRIADTMRRLESADEATSKKAKSNSAKSNSAKSATAKSNSAKSATAKSNSAKSKNSTKNSAGGKKQRASSNRANAPALRTDTGRPPGRTRKLILSSLAAVVFATGAGFLLAQYAGERQVGETLTGGGTSLRQRVFDCQQFGSSGEILAAIECFDEVLVDNPDNAESLTYRGWFGYLAAASAEGAGDTETASELVSIAATFLDRAIESNPRFPDARAFRSVIYDRQGESVKACQEVETLLALNPPPFFEQQTAAIAERNC